MRQFLLYTLFLLFIISGCRKSDNPKIPELSRVPTPLIQLDPSSDKFINPGNPSLFNGKIIADLFFKTDVKPQVYDVVVRKTRGTSKSVKVVQSNVTTFPAAITITGQQLITLFGEAITGGDLFEFGADITTTAGSKFEAFPAVGSPYSSGVGNQVGASTSVSFITPCAFNADLYQGDFTVLEDQWQDYAVGTTIKLTKVSATKVSFEYAVDAGTAKPIVLTINSSDNSVSVVKQEYGSYGPDVVSAESVVGASSAVNPCDLSLSVNLKHSTSSGVIGNYIIRLKKK